ncbi:hypothetical protein LOD99_8133 [Oopsacas minuta]|uniref:UBX domain-containing protein 1 n=1 Tax=Oopsacas minuta TaxID=111878 RepID=A0AAV7JIC4_9METZ|nr:hypothetical protein LOD99_8133 [Oopsacas minuta]
MSDKAQVLESLQDFGFTAEQAGEAWEKSGSKTLDAALNYLVEQQEGKPGVEEDHVTPSATAPEGTSGGAEAEDQEASGVVAQSLKCDECGKQLRSTVEAETHAARTGHSSFSESAESVKPLTQEEREQQLAKLEEIRKAKRIQREEEEKARHRDDELRRREMGKQVAMAKHEREKQEAMLIATERRREKKEQAEAKKRIKEEIAKDRADQKAASTARKITAVEKPVEAEAPREKKEYTECKLNLRLLDGKSMPTSFKPDQLLHDVRLFLVAETGLLEFELGTTFPRKVYALEDYKKTLKELGLVPSAALIVSKSS